MTDVRIWHAARDAYHCAFRILRLLSAKDREIEFERLRILDMYLLFPSLLHRTAMPREVRSEFSQLGIERPEEKFIRLPSNAAIFQELRLYQNSAVGQLAARGLVGSTGLKNGIATVDQTALPKPLLSRIAQKNSSEEGLVGFLLGSFSSLPLRGKESMYRRAGLPTRVFAE
jgi:hypothetical protein